MTPSGETSVGRIPIVGVQPSLEEGRWPARAVVGESVPITATIFREGHDAEGATVVITKPDGRHERLPMPLHDWGTSLYRAAWTPKYEGLHTFRVEAWSDPVATWLHAAEVKIHAGVDVQLMLDEGVAVLTRARTEVRRADSRQAVIDRAIASLQDGTLAPEARLAPASSHELKDVLTATPLRDWVSASREYPILIQRERALVSSWYEIFPRSEGARQVKRTGEWRSGTFSTAARRLPAIADMGFDVVYLTPIHPIGLTHRKGRNNSLKAEPGDPGSPYAIGAAEGGHDAIHPDLGTMRGFRSFVKAARSVGLEVALVPEGRADARGIVADFPEGSGRVLAPLGNLASPVLARGLGRKGWQVDVVEAYRTVDGPGPDDATVAEVAAGAFDAVLLTAGSVAELGLQPGSRVWVSVKATELHAEAD